MAAQEVVAAVVLEVVMQEEVRQPQTPVEVAGDQDLAPPEAMVVRESSFSVIRRRKRQA